MKKFFFVLAALCCFMISFAQNNVFVWHGYGNNCTIDVTSFARYDSITFDAPVASSITLATGDPIEVTKTAMTAYCVASGLNFQGVKTERGVCYSSVENEPTVNNNKAVDGQYSTGKWKVTIKNLDTDRTYYYRSYAIVGSDSVYGPIKSFSTGNGTQLFATPTAVDLELSVKWASCNLGATKPEGYGGYYAWGEILTKKYYDWSTYKYGTVHHITKYNTEDGLDTLSPDDDAATYNLGKPWRMATDDEWSELFHNCTYEWEKISGVDGLRFVSKLNGNSIFLPAAGNEGSSYINFGGRYWETSVYQYDHSRAKCLIFLKDKESMGTFEIDRFEGYSIRPVCP